MSGFNAREIVTKATGGRPPVYVPTLRGWSCQERAARDACVIAEQLGYDVVIQGPLATRVATPRIRDHEDEGTRVPSAPSNVDRRLVDDGGGLW